MRTFNAHLILICVALGIIGFIPAANAELVCPPAETVQRVMGLPDLPSLNASKDSCAYTLNEGSKLWILPGNKYIKADSWSDFKEWMGEQDAKCVTKPSLGSSGLWCVSRDHYFLGLNIDETGSQIQLDNWPTDEDDAEPRAEALARHMFLGTPLPRSMPVSRTSQPVYDPKLGFALQKGLWQLTTTTTPHIARQDQSGIMGSLLQHAKVSNYCSTGKPAEGLSARMGQQGCTVIVKPMSPALTTADATCTTKAAAGGTTQLLVHSEMKLINPKHAVTQSQSVTKGIGDDFVTDATQEWVFLSPECGELGHGENKQ